MKVPPTMARGKKMTVERAAVQPDLEFQAPAAVVQPGSDQD